MQTSFDTIKSVIEQHSRERGHNAAMILKALFYYLFQRPKAQQADTKPTDSADLYRFLGRWYELARFDTPFEKGLEEVYTEYKVCEDGNIKITNYGIDANHHRHEAHAMAYPTDQIGQLKVSFIPLLRFINSPYNILHIDDCYMNALVSNDSGSCLWFLSRRPVIVPESFNKLRHEAQHRGFDLHDLHFTRHRYHP